MASSWLTRRVLTLKMRILVGDRGREDMGVWEVDVGQQRQACG